MKSFLYTLKEKIWIYPGDAAWHFITIQKEVRVKEKIENQDIVSLTLEVVN